MTQPVQIRLTATSITTETNVIPVWLSNSKFDTKNGKLTLHLGLGAKEAQNTESFRKAGATLVGRLGAEKIHKVNFLVDEIETNAQAIGALIEGLLLASYRFARYRKPAEKPHKQLSINFVTKSAKLRKDLAEQIQNAQLTVEAMTLTRDWVNEPSNIGTPEYFAKEARTWAKRLGLRCKILGPKELGREKMGLLLGVGQGSRRPSQVVILEHRPTKTRGKAPLIALVGKGVTFDSGGISIKPSARMEEMKYDMGGAATVMGAMALAARRKVKTHVVAVLAFVENMPGGNAVQPGNILRSRAGKTVEIISTDAEGRLILADAMDFVQDMKPDTIIDVATLTGGCGIAFGKVCCAVIGNDDHLIKKLQTAATNADERMWQLPLYDEYFDDLKTEHADLRNSTGDSQAQTIKAAMFLKQFVRKDVKWAHLDIASTVANAAHLPYCPKKGASGLFVRALANFIEQPN
jgi:leucyl aminopeptidase